MLQLCEGTTIIENIGNQKSRNPLDCVHEKVNPFDSLAIKVMDQDTGATVGYLPMQNFQATKFLLNRSATNYCVSPLVQGRLEIPCRVKIYMSPTFKGAL